MEHPFHEHPQLRQAKFAPRCSGMNVLPGKMEEEVLSCNERGVNLAGLFLSTPWLSVGCAAI